MSDPRARSVVSHSKVGADHVVTLECGHEQRRRFLYVPNRVICVECPVPEEWAARNLRKQQPWPDEQRPVLERMAVAQRQMTARRRTPRVFYLTPDDWTLFVATEPPTIRATFNGSAIDVLGFEKLAVCASKGKGRSALYCCSGTTIYVPPR